MQDERLKTWVVLALGGPEGVAEYAVAAGSRTEARQAFLAAGFRSLKGPPALGAAVPEALTSPGTVVEKDWRTGQWHVVGCG